MFWNIFGLAVLAGRRVSTLRSNAPFRGKRKRWGIIRGFRSTVMAKRSLQLGHPAAIPASPSEAVLDRVPNPHPDTNYIARFTFPEFTVMCPVTGQPDFATLVIDYVPKNWLVESKSLKLYLNSFRNHGAFHEECTVA